MGGEVSKEDFKKVQNRVEETEKHFKQLLKEQKEDQDAKRKAEQDELCALRAQQHEAQERELKEPWRHFAPGGDWTDEYQATLIERIQKHEQLKDLEDSPRALLLGPQSSGKSSFINSIASIDKGRMAKPMLAGASSTSVTQKLKQYVTKGCLKNIRLLDTMGLEDSDGAGFNINDVVSLIEGHVKLRYKFNPRTSIASSDEQYYNKEPSTMQKAHCVVIVMSACVIGTNSVSDQSKEKIKAIKKNFVDQDVIYMLVLTKIDELCPGVAKDITTTYHSRLVGNVVKEASKIFDIQEMDIFPVQNYTKQMHPDSNMNILLLLALQRIIDYASDRLESLKDQED